MQPCLAWHRILVDSQWNLRVTGTEVVHYSIMFLKYQYTRIYTVIVVAHIYSLNRAKYLTYIDSFQHNESIIDFLCVIVKDDAHFNSHLIAQAFPHIETDLPLNR